MPYSNLPIILSLLFHVINQRHKNAIEFIENNRFKPEKEILNEFQKLCNSENSIYNIQFDSKYCDITHIRFKTKGMNEFIRENEIDQKNGSWNSNQEYYYELVVDFKKNHMVFGQLSFKLCNCDTDDKLKISQIFRKKPDDDADWEVKTGRKVTSCTPTCRGFNSEREYCPAGLD